MVTGQKPLLEPGRYRAEQDGDVFHAYLYVMEVRETDKSYIFKMLESRNRYADDQLETMFGGKSKVIIPKNKRTRHAMRVWSARDFTIYPFQAGVPFYFRKEETA